MNPNKKPKLTSYEPNRIETIEQLKELHEKMRDIDFPKHIDMTIVGNEIFHSVLHTESFSSLKLSDDELEEYGEITLRFPRYTFRILPDTNSSFIGIEIDKA